MELIQTANRRVHERAVSDSAASGMGTTMTVALFRPDGSVVIGHVGDSRAYLLREGTLEQLTEDHSLVAELVRRGELSPEQAEVHPQRSVITRALGTEPEVAVDAFTVAAHDGDVFLLCSDGLTTMVDCRDDRRPGAASPSRSPRRRPRARCARRTTVAATTTSPPSSSRSIDDEHAPGRQPFEDEDTLHPEDEVTLPAIALSPSEGPAPGEALAAAVPAANDAEAPGQPSTLRLFAAGLAIVVLAALIIVLVVKGFAQ